MDKIYTSIKVKKDTLRLLKKARAVFLHHNPTKDGFRDEVIRKALEYYIKV